MLLFTVMVLFVIVFIYFDIKLRKKMALEKKFCPHCKKEYEKRITLEAFDLYYKEGCPNCHRELPLLHE